MPASATLFADVEADLAREYGPAPEKTPRLEVFRENVEFLRSCGLTDETIARRLGIAYATFEVKARKAKIPARVPIENRHRVLLDRLIESGEPFTVDDFPTPEHNRAISALLTNAKAAKRIRAIGRRPILGKKSLTVWIAA